MNKIINVLKARADEVQYHENPILEKDQPEFLRDLADELLKVDKQLVKLHELVLDAKTTVTRGMLAAIVTKIRGDL